MTMSSVVKPGAVRIGTTGYTANGITYSAFEKTDGTYAVSYTHLDVYKRQLLQSTHILAQLVQLGNLRLVKHSKRVFLRNQRVKAHQQFFYLFTVRCRIRCV